MEETEQRLAAARAKRATAQALIDAQKQLVDQADKEERALKEQLDAERTSAYEGKFVRGQSINGTVRAVKYGEAYISWADGVDYAIKFEHLDMCLERYEDWAAGVLQDWDCAPSGACLDGLEAPPPLVEAEPATDAAPALPSPRSVVATPAVAPLVAAAPVLPLIEEAPKPLPKPLIAERVVAATTADDDDVPVEAVVDDVAAATGGHKAAGEILPTRQAQPVAEPGGADADAGSGADDGGADAEQGVDAHGVEAQGADAEMEGADAEEGGGDEEPLDADGVEAATGGAEGDVVVEEGAAEGGVAGGVDMEGVEATGGADGEEGAVEAMEEGDDDTISIMETGVGVAGATGAVEEEGGLEAHGVEDVVATGVAEGDDGHRMLGVPSNAVDTVSTVIKETKDIKGGDRVLAFHGEGKVDGRPVSKLPAIRWWSGTVQEVAGATSSRFKCSVLYDDLVLETDLPGRFVRRLLAEADPRAGPPPLHASPAMRTNAPGHLVETSTALQLAAAPKPPPKKKKRKAPTPKAPPKKKKKAPPPPPLPAPTELGQAADTALVDVNDKPAEVVESRWHPSGCDLCSRPLVLSDDRAVVIGWLPAAESRFLVDGERAALYKAAFTTGHRVGATVDLGEEEVREYLAPEALPSAEDYKAAAAAAVGIRWATEFAGGAGAGEDSLANDSQRIPDHVLLQPEAVFPPTRDARVGRLIEVYWAGDKVWYKGRVVGQKIVNGAVHLSVKYDDGDEHDEELQDEPFAGEGVPPDDRKPWYWRVAEPPNEAALPEVGAELADAALLYEPGADESAAVPPPPEFQLCRELSEACDTVATSSSAETPPRAATPKRSLTVTLCIGNKAKKQKTDVDAEAEFEFKDENQNNAKVLSLLKELQEIEIAASQHGL